MSTNEVGSFGWLCYFWGDIEQVGKVRGYYQNDMVREFAKITGPTVRKL